MQLSLIPQSELYTIFDEHNPLYKLAVTHPDNMCWLATLFYALQYMGFESNKKLHRKLAKLLYISYDLMEVNQENGALMFVKKYELGDKQIRANLNDLFKEINLKVKVEKIISNITYDEIEKIRQYLLHGKQLLTIIKNINLLHPNEEPESDIPNHVVLIKEIDDTHDGMLRIVFLDPSYGKFLEGKVGVHAFVLWIQYIWVLERRRNIVHKIFFNKASYLNK